MKAGNVLSSFSDIKLVLSLTKEKKSFAFGASFIKSSSVFSCGASFFSSLSELPELQLIIVSIRNAMTI
jgi:hypothetical protein